MIKNFLSFLIIISFFNFHTYSQVYNRVSCMDSLFSIINRKSMVSVNGSNGILMNNSLGRPYILCVPTSAFEVPEAHANVKLRFGLGDVDCTSPIDTTKQLVGINIVSTINAILPSGVYRFYIIEPTEPIPPTWDIYLQGWDRSYNKNSYIDDFMLYGFVGNDLYGKKADSLTRSYFHGTGWFYQINTGVASPNRFYNINSENKLVSLHISTFGGSGNEIHMSFFDSRLSPIFNVLSPTDTSMVSVKYVSPTTSIKMINGDLDFETYPNPSKGELFIDLNDSKYDLNLYDLNGRVIYSDKNVSGKYKFNIDLPKGVYILNLNNGKESGSKKIVIE